MPDIAKSTVLLTALAGHARAAVRFAVADLTDDEWSWQPSTPDVMTIGWRVGHLVAVLETYNANTFDADRVAFADNVAPVGVEEAVTRLHAAQDAFVGHVGALADDALDAPTRSHWGDALPLWQLVWTEIVEQFHHGAEIGALRDVKRGRPRTDWWPELQGRDWWPTDFTD